MYSWSYLTASCCWKEATLLFSNAFFPPRLPFMGWLFPSSLQFQCPKTLPQTCHENCRKWSAFLLGPLLMFSWVQRAQSKVKRGVNSRGDVARSRAGGGHGRGAVSMLLLITAHQAAWDPSFRSSQSALEWLIQNKNIVSSANVVTSFIYPFPSNLWICWNALHGNFLASSVVNHDANNSFSFFANIFWVHLSFPTLLVSHRNSLIGFLLLMCWKRLLCLYIGP